MRRYPPRTQFFAALLAALAGYVDAIGFLTAGGYFVSFMSGNSTRFGVGLLDGSRQPLIAGGVVLAFLGGVMSGALLGRTAGPRRRGPLLLALVALVLATSAVLHASGAMIATIVTMAVAMGVMNNVFEDKGEVSVGLTYMTGSIVKLGQRLAAALLGHDRRGWIPFFLLWMGFTTGAIVGACTQAAAPRVSVWAASGMAALLALAAPRLGPGSSQAAREAEQAHGSAASDPPEAHRE